MKIILAIGLGSSIGGMLRYVLAESIRQKLESTLPFGTFTINVVGCFLIGIVFGLFDRGNLSQEWRLFLATGLLGGFTTFSAFSMETVNLLRDGQYWSVITYVAGSVVIGLLATFAGISITKIL
ncbi:MAG TPA: fluoride efflux transporter CrcB [Saprospirales bacterium]|nr:fluoride efflux transporter CrcB [Saprospirales bacterium]